MSIAHTQVLIGALSPLLSQAVSGLIQEALAVRPSGIIVTHITATPGAPGTIILSGTAAQLEAINTYQTSLRANTHFSSVSVPVSDLAGTADGRFSVTLSSVF